MFILAVDQGTTGTTTVLYNEKGEIVQKATQEFTQIYPRPGWVEHDPEEIWQTVVDTIEEVVGRWELADGIIQSKPLAIGITNQRETTVVWRRSTGEPVYNAIVWQCRRTAKMCQSFESSKDLIREKTGLPLDAYFSATKIKWILDNVDIDDPGDLCFGTIDTWLIWKLTGGQVHATDMTNASRTLLFNIDDKIWDLKLCSLFNVQGSMLPEVKNSIDDYGVVSALDPINGIPIYGVAGDQQAALFGQACFEQGQVKNTYGTGSFMVMNTGQERIHSQNGLVTTLAASETGAPCYALEGAIFIAGAAIQWCRDELDIIENASDSEAMATALEDNGGVYLIPAFAGLGAPHWDMAARGALVGLTRGSNRFHIVRAALEAMAYQSMDVLKAMELDSHITIKQLVVDGGAVANNFLMQFQADMIQRPVLRPNTIESTSLGVAMMAGLKAGVWKSAEELTSLKVIDRTFEPTMDSARRDSLVSGWQQALMMVKRR